MRASRASRASAGWPASRASANRASLCADALELRASGGGAGRPASSSEPAARASLQLLATLPERSPDDRSDGGPLTVPGGERACTAARRSVHAAADELAAQLSRRLTGSGEPARLTSLGDTSSERDDGTPDRLLLRNLSNPDELALVRVRAEREEIARDHTHLLPPTHEHVRE